MNPRANAGWARRAGALALVALAGGCTDDAPRLSAPEPPPTAPLTSSARAELPAASAAPGPSEVSLSGTWKGAYDAKKGTVELPAQVKDKSRRTDDGKTSAGPGTVTLTVSPDGDVRGKARGALGDATLTGKSEDDMIRASVFPDDPRAPNAMTGILVGRLKDGVIQGELRVAGPDAAMVRESPIELKRQ